MDEVAETPGLNSSPVDFGKVEPQGQRLWR